MITSSRPAPAAACGSAIDSEAHAYFRALLDRLSLRAGAENTLRTLGLTSCQDGEGVSTVAAQLALTAALDSDRRVLLVDANPTRPALHRMFSVANGTGWSDVLQGAVEAAAVVQAVEPPGLFVMASGDLQRVGEAAGLERAVAQLQIDFDLVIFDMPPANEASGCGRLAGLVDGVLLVVEAERVRWQVAQHAKERLQRSDARLLGAVLNKRRQHVPGWLYRTL